MNYLLEFDSCKRFVSGGAITGTCRTLYSFLPLILRKVTRFSSSK